MGITTQRSTKTQRHRYSLSYKMPHLSYLLLACLGLAAAAPRGTVQERQHGVHCRTEYITVWDTEYEERETQECVTKWVPECRTVTERKCEPTSRNVCDKVYEKKCSTVWKNVCEEEYKTEYVTVTETECTTKNSKDCKYMWEGKGDNMKWVIIPGSCNIQPHDKCKDVTKQVPLQVPHEVCREVEEEECKDVPSKVCRQVPDEVCSYQPVEKCTKKPKKGCENEHKKIPVRVSKRIAKKVCDSDDGYANPLSIPEYDEYDVEVIGEIGERSGGQRRIKRSTDNKKSSEECSSEENSSEECSSEEDSSKECSSEECSSSEEC